MEIQHGYFYPPPNLPPETSPYYNINASLKLYICRYEQCQTAKYPEEFFSGDALREHITQHFQNDMPSGPPYLCKHPNPANDRCVFEWKLEYFCRTHILYYNTNFLSLEGPFLCTFKGCNFPNKGHDFGNPSSLFSHKNWHSRVRHRCNAEEIFYCNYSGCQEFVRQKPFYRRGYLRHLKHHSSDSQLCPHVNCKGNARIFSLQSDLDLHVRRCHGGIKCGQGQCDFTGSYISLRFHRHKEHDLDAIPATQLPTLEIPSRQIIDAEEKAEHDAWSEGEYESEGPTGTENNDQLQSRASYVPSLANYIRLQSDQGDEPHEQDRYIIQQYMNQLSDGVPLDDTFMLIYNKAVIISNPSRRVHCFKTKPCPGPSLYSLVDYMHEPCIDNNVLNLSNCRLHIREKPYADGFEKYLGFRPRCHSCNSMFALVYRAKEVTVICFNLRNYLYCRFVRQGQVRTTICEVRSSIATAPTNLPHLLNQLHAPLEAEMDTCEGGSERSENNQQSRNASSSSSFCVH